MGVKLRSTYQSNGQTFVSYFLCLKKKLKEPEKMCFVKARQINGKKEVRGEMPKGALLENSTPLNCFWNKGVNR